MCSSAKVISFFYQLVCFAFFLIGGISKGAELTPLEKRGQHLYRTGTTLEGKKIPTFLGDSKNSIPSSLFACTNCHGPDGKGVPEGGVKPSNITWHGLTKPYGAISGTHRGRPPYNEEQILTAIRKGTDPFGQPLEKSMPRFHLDPEDEKAIIAYLKIIHLIDDPGVTSKKLHLGIILPPEPNYEIIQNSLQTYFNRVNQEGGIYRRLIHLEVLRLGKDPSHWGEQWNDFLNQKSLFALISPVMKGVDQKELGDLIQKAKIPVISPLLVNPKPLIIPNPYIFYFYPSLEIQTQALEQFAKKEFSSATIIKGVDDIQTQQPPNALIIDTPQATDIAKVLETLQKENLTPTLLLPHLHSIPELTDYPGDIYFSYPFQSTAHPQEPQALQKSSLIAADLLRTILLQMGRKVTRQKLIDKLETFHQQKNNWTAPLTFNPNHRIGPLGAYITKPSPEWNTQTPWIHLKE